MLIFCTPAGSGPPNGFTRSPAWGTSTSSYTCDQPWPCVWMATRTCASPKSEPRLNHTLPQPAAPRFAGGGQIIVTEPAPGSIRPVAKAGTSSSSEGLGLGLGLGLGAGADAAPRAAISSLTVPR